MRKKPKTKGRKKREQKRKETRAPAKRKARVEEPHDDEPDESGADGSRCKPPPLFPEGVPPAGFFIDEDDPEYDRE